MVNLIIIIIIIQFENAKSPFLGEDRRFCLALLWSDLIPLSSSLQCLKDPCIVLGLRVVRVEVMDAVFPDVRVRPPLSGVLSCFGCTESVVTLEAPAASLAVSQLSPAERDRDDDFEAVCGVSLSLTPACVPAEQSEVDVK